MWVPLIWHLNPLLARNTSDKCYIVLRMYASLFIYIQYIYVCVYVCMVEGLGREAHLFVHACVFAPFSFSENVA